MLDAGRPFERLDGLTLFFDHADEQRRYVLAEVPGVIADPAPRVSLVLYRGEQSGGLLQFEVALAPSPAQLASVESTLARTGRRPTLVRPDWRGGTVKVAGWLQAGELAPVVLAVGAPSLVGDPVSVIVARLDAAGAALADAALNGNALPTVVMFELETLGLAGPLGIEVHTDLRALHDRLTAEGALTTPYGRARIAKTWEEAARDSVIAVSVVDESGDAQGHRAEAMRRVGEDLIARMFSPFPPSERPPQLDNGSVAPIELGFRLTARREELATSASWDFRERRAVPVRHYAAASLIDLLGERPASDHISFADLHQDHHEVVIRAEPELGRLGLLAVEVDVRRGPDQAVERTCVLTDSSPEQVFQAAGPPVPRQYRVRTHFDPEETRADDRESDWLDAVSGLIVVSARRLFPPRTLTVIAGRVELDWLAHIAVRVDAPGDAPRLLRLSADAQSAEAFFPGTSSEPLVVTAEWHGLPGEPSRLDPPREVAGDILVLDSPFADSIAVLVVPLPLPDVATIVVQLRTMHEGFEHARTVSWDAPDRGPQRIGLRRLAGSPRRYSYRVQVIHQDGRVTDVPWTETDKPSLVVPAGDAMEVHTVDVVLLGGGPAARGSVAVALALAAGDALATEVLEAEQDTARLVLVVESDAPTPVLTAREFLPSGEVRETRWDAPESLIVLPPASGAPR